MATRRKKASGFAVATKSENARDWFTKPVSTSAGHGTTPSAKTRTWQFIQAHNTGSRLRVADVVEGVGSGSREALRELNQEGKIALFPLDNRREITARDERNAIMIAGDPHHVLYVR